MRVFLFIFAVLLLFPLSATAQQPDDAPPLPKKQSKKPYDGPLQFNDVSLGDDSGQSVVTAPPPPVPDFISNKQVTFTPQEREALRLASEWEKNAISPFIAQEGGKIVFAYGASVPTLVCAPLRISDLELQRGETVNDIVIGDSARWHTDIVEVGSGLTTPHVIFKPLDASLETSVVITTNLRAYHVTLKSDRSNFTPFAGFSYQKEIHTGLASARKKIEQKQEHFRNEEGVDISNLDFRYAVEGKPRWKPVQVFNDSVKTYIKMPASVAQGEMPVLLVENKKGQALVNYRINNNTFVVDQLFEKAVLIVGVGSDQEKVTIEWEKG